MQGTWLGCECSDSGKKWWWPDQDKVKVWRGAFTRPRNSLSMAECEGSRVTLSFQLTGVAGGGVRRKSGLRRKVIKSVVCVC